jgi:competence protein ComGC
VVKLWHVVIVLIVISLILTFLVPPAIRCKLYFWNSKACDIVKQSVESLRPFGIDINPNAPLITQVGELGEGVTKIAGTN